MKRLVVSATLALLAAIGWLTPYQFGLTSSSQTSGHLSFILDLSFVDPSHGWVLGVACGTGCNRLAMRHTSDGGRIWRPLSAPATAPGWVGSTNGNAVHAIRFADAHFGWAFGPALFATRDGGRTWTRERVPGAVVDLVAVGRSAWVLSRTCSRSSACHFTLLVGRPGARWQRTVLPMAASGAGAQLVRAPNGAAWIVTSEQEQPHGITSSLFRSRGGPARWQRLPNPCTTLGPFAPKLVALGANRLWIVCPSEPGAGAQMKWLYRSADGGVHWSLAASSNQRGGLPIAGYVHDLDISDPSHLWLSLDRNTLYAGASGGRRWRVAIPLARANPDDGTVGRVVFVDRSHGWFAGGQNLVFRTDDAGRHWRRVAVQ